MPEEIKAKDAKLIQYLNEAYGTERRLETALTAHIQMATRSPYKKRLTQHLSETKRHAREVERRIKALGGKPEGVDVPGPDAAAEAASRVVAAGQRAAALAQGPLHALRGTGEAERQLKNAKTEYADEHEEIATYSAIETLAQTVGDRETVTLARSIRREEERMAKFLEKEIALQTKAVARAEIPAAERNGGRRRKSTSRRRTSASRNGSKASGGSRSSSRSRAASRSRSSSASRNGGGSSSRRSGSRSSSRSSRSGRKATASR